MVYLQKGETVTRTAINKSSRTVARAGDSTNDDIRRERTRARLAQAVLSIASERDIGSASIAELTKRAGIYRTTFYSHAETPTELLVKVLSDELDLVRQEGIVELEKGGRLRRGLSHRLLGEVADHAVKHRTIYASADRTTSTFALRSVLAEHIEASIALYIQKGFLTPPSLLCEDIALYSRFIAHGMAGAVETWLRFSVPQDREQLLRAIEATLPAWYAPELPSELSQPDESAHVAPTRPSSRGSKRRTK